MTKTTMFKVGLAQRKRDGSIHCYAVSADQECASLEQCRSHIRLLRMYDEKNGLNLPVDEYTPVEIVTYIHDPEPIQPPDPAGS